LDLISGFNSQKLDAKNMSANFHLDSVAVRKDFKQDVSRNFKPYCWSWGKRITFACLQFLSNPTNPLHRDLHWSTEELIGYFFWPRDLSMPLARLWPLQLFASVELWTFVLQVSSAKKTKQRIWEQKHSVDDMTWLGYDSTRLLYNSLTATLWHLKHLTKRTPWHTKLINKQAHSQLFAFRLHHITQHMHMWM